MIQRVLVPTDFSEVAANALIYALEFADYLELPAIEVVHIYSPQTAPDMVALPPVNELMDQRTQQLESFLADLPSKKKYTTEVKRMVQLGFPADELARISTEFDLIIMGTTADGGFLERIFGSTSSTVGQRANCPVILVPPEARFREYRHLLYASSDLSVSRKVVLRFMAFNHLFRARVHFIHINDDGGEAHRGQREKLFAALFSGPEPEFAFDITEMEAESVVDGLEAYFNEHPIDLAVMVTERRSFWDAFFHRSQTKAMILHTKVPLLVLHLVDFKV